MGLFSLPSFRHGIHPNEHKEQTASKPILRMPFVERYTLPLGQHIGAPSVPIVSVGEDVVRGQMLAKAGGFVSTSLHSPVTGTVVDIGHKRLLTGEQAPCIEIKADPYSSQLVPQKEPIDWKSLTREEFIDHVQQAGLAGMGGAAFPSHVKYALPNGKTCEWLVINGCECEPYLTCDHRLMAEAPESILRGTEILSYHLNAKGIAIGIEANKPDAIEALEKAIEEKKLDNVKVFPLKVKYPQGAEKMLIQAVFGKEVPAGKFPLDLGMVVNNVATMASLADYFDHNKPVIERVVTVTGGGVESPGNLMIPIGTHVKEILNFCGMKPDARLVVSGGPMMGRPVSSLNVPVLKGTSGLIVFTKDFHREKEELPCVRCGRCLEACSNFLNPSLFVRLSKAKRYDDLLENYIMDCTECGACSFGCPSGIPIVQHIRIAKSSIRKK